MFKLSPVERIAYKERAYHDHPDLFEKLGKILKMPVNTKKINRNFTCKTKTVCTKVSPLDKFTRKKGKKKKKNKKKRKKTVKN